MSRERVLGRLRAFAVAATCLALGMGFAACGGDDDDGGDGGGGGGDGPVAVRGAILPTATHLPIMVADKEGIFEKNGVDMKVTVVQNIATLPGAMGRQFDFGSTTLPDVIKAQQQGIEVVITSNVADETSPDHEISGVFARKGSGIEGPQDLVGKTVGVIAIGGNIHTSTLFWLTKEGVDHEKIKFIEVPPPNQLDQLNSGDIDAAENLEPFRTAITKAGHKLLVDPILEVSEPATLLSWMSERKWAEENPETVEKVVASINEAIEFIEQNDKRARNILAEVSGLPPEVAQAVKLPEYNTQIPEEQVTAWAEMLQTIGELKGDPEDVDPKKILAIPQE